MIMKISSISNEKVLRQLEAAVRSCRRGRAGTVGGRRRRGARLPAVDKVTDFWLINKPKPEIFGCRAGQAPAGGPIPPAGPLKKTAFS